MRSSIQFYSLLFLNIFLAFILALGLVNFYQDLKDYFNLKQEVKKAELKYREYLQDARFLKENKVKIAIFEDSFVDADNPLLFISYLEDEAKRNNLKVGFIDINQKEEVGGKTTSKLNFRVQVCGDFKKFSTFLGSLEHPPYILNLNSLNISRVEKKVKESHQEKCGFLKPGEIKAVLEIETPIKISN